MSWQVKYTPAQLEIIKKEFKDAPPTACKGDCRICSFVIAWCRTCGWDEDFPVETLPQTQ